MDNHYLALKALKRIIDERTPFQIVLEKLVNDNNLSLEDKAYFKIDVLGSIRHFAYLQYEAITAFPQFKEDDDEIYLIILALYQLRYHSKDIARFQVIEKVVATIDYMDLNLDVEEVKLKLEVLATEKTPLPEPLRSDPYAYNALFFNTPLWLLKMWTKEYGDEATMNMLIANQRRAHSFLAINTSTKTAEDFIDDERFKTSLIVPTALEYSAGPCSKLQEVRDGELFAQDLSNQIMLENLDFNYNMRALHVGSISGGIAAGLALRLLPYLGTVDALFADERNFRRGRYIISRLALKNLKAFLGDYNLTKTYNPYESYDLVIDTPISSHLGQIRIRPDILVTIKKQDIDFYSRQAIKSLTESAKFVAAGGKLIYAVNTLTYEENEKVVNNIIKNSDGKFVLEYQRTIFPYEYASDGLYFAIIKRIN